MVVLNEMDRFHQLMDVVEHRRYIERYGEDMPEIRDWRWAGEKQGGTS